MQLGPSDALPPATMELLIHVPPPFCGSKMFPPQDSSAFTGLAVLPYSVT
jgi:hypothetical protein